VVRIPEHKHVYDPDVLVFRNPHHRSAALRAARAVLRTPVVEKFLCSLR
jgi:hypothetical protein